MRYLTGAVLFFAVLGMHEAAAQTPDGGAPLSNLYACQERSEPTERLQCYDEAVGHLRAAEAAGDMVAVDRSQVSTLERESFGFQFPSLSSLLIRRTESEPIDRIESQVVRVIQHADRRSTFILANGQSWIQIESRPATNVRPGDTVAVRRAALGSFMLSPARGAAHRVRRVE
ncbi:MAG: hypothetical protein R3C25_06205 [Hyphomonadaceae bacterium]